MTYDPNLFSSLARQYTGGINAPVPGQAGYVAIVNSEANNLEYVTGATIRGGAVLVTEAPYSAVGDGITVSTTGLQAAITENAGREILFPGPAVYVVDAALSIPSNTTLRAIGHVVIYLADGANNHVLRIADDATDVEIIGLEIDGNRANNPTGGHGITSGGDGARYRLIDCDIHDCAGDGVRWIGDTAVSDVIVRGCRAWSNGIAGFSADNVEYMTITGCEAWDNSTHGIGWVGVAGYVTVTGCIARDNGVGTPTADNFTGYSHLNHHITFTGNVSEGNTHNGIHLGGDYVTVCANVSTGAGEAGIILAPDVGYTNDFVVVNGNVVDSAAGANAGIWVNNYDHISVTGNVVTNTTAAHGIQISAATSGSVSGNTVHNSLFDGLRVQNCAQLAIGSNLLVGNGSDGIQLQNSTECVIVGNSCKDNYTVVTEDGTSDNNLWSANELRGNTGVTPSFAGGTGCYYPNNPNAGTVSVASATTTTLPKYVDYVVVTGTTTITSITASWRGRIVTLKFSGVLTFTDGSNLKLAGNFTTSADDTITLRCDGTNWYEVARSVN